MQNLVVYLNVICADFGDIFFLKVPFKLTPNTSLYIIIKITQMNKTVRINISKNGIFLGNERFNMLEYQFNEIRLRNHFYIVESDTSPDANCVICYDFKPEKTAFFSELDLWFTCDNKSLSENDYKKLAAFYDDNPVFNGRCNRYKLCADINFCDFDFSDANRDVSSPVVRDELSSSMGISSVVQIAVPAGIGTISYNCQLSKNKETGLNRFHFVLDYKSFYTDDFLNSDVFKTQEALWNAVFSENIEKVSSLLKQNINVNFCERYKLGHPLDIAIIKNNSSLCELLILHGADLNHINGYGYYNSSIWLAKSANAYEAGKVLIKYGARFDIFDEIDNCYVSPDGTEHYENLDFLLKCGANPNQGTKENIFSPLMYAVSKNNISAARLLLKYGADVNAVTKDGGTALRIAVILNLPEMAGLLIEYGADVNSFTDGMTNLEQALYYEENNKEMIQLLAFCGGAIQTDASIIYYSKAEDNYLVWLDPYIQLNLTENKEILIRLLYLGLLYKHCIFGE